VPLDWPGVTDTHSGLSHTADARWTLQNGKDKGIGGSLYLNGNASLQACSLKELGVALAFGETENYFSGKGKGTVVVAGIIPLDVEAGIFAGHACSLAPVMNVDSEAVHVLPANTTDYKGVYIHFGASLNLIRAAGCLLDANAYMTTAYYWQGGAGWGAFGGRQKMGIDATLLCVIGANVDWAEYIRIDTAGPSFTVGGTASVGGKIGICPICKHASFDIDISGTLSPGGIDYHIDF